MSRGLGRERGSFSLPHLMVSFWFPPRGCLFCGCSLECLQGEPLLFYAMHIIAGGLVSGEGVYSRSALFCTVSSSFLPGTSAVDSVPLLLPPVPSHPLGKMQLQAVSTAELSKTPVRWHLCWKQVGGQSSSKPSLKELSPSQAPAKSTAAEWNGPGWVALRGVKPAEQSGRGQHCV